MSMFNHRYKPGFDVLMFAFIQAQETSGFGHKVAANAPGVGRNGVTGNEVTANARWKGMLRIPQTACMWWAVQCTHGGKAARKAA